MLIAKFKSAICIQQFAVLRGPSGPLGSGRVAHRDDVGGVLHADGGRVHPDRDETDASAGG
jgi:hypothetical protein